MGDDSIDTVILHIDMGCLVTLGARARAKAWCLFIDYTRNRLCLSAFVAVDALFPA